MILLHISKDVSIHLQICEAARVVKLNNNNLHQETADILQQMASWFIFIHKSYFEMYILSRHFLFGDFKLVCSYQEQNL